MKKLGAHVSMAGGIWNAPINAHAIGAKSFAMFTKNQKQWFAKPLENEDVRQFKETMEKLGYAPEDVLAHDSYLINIGHPNKESREQSFNSFSDEIKRCQELGIAYLNIHPGTTLKEITESECLRNIAESINRVLDISKGVTVVLENTAGQGSNVGYKFEHLAEIIAMVEDKSRIGVCVDTCHAFAAGYDIRTKEGYDKVTDEFEKIIGFKYLKGMHINDSKSAYSSRVDRHESIGKGNIGIEPFKFIMNDVRIDNIPMVLETIVPEIWAEEIKFLYSLIV